LHSFDINDGANPWAGLITIGRKLYGTAPSGGRHGDGTVFSINAVTGATATLHAFAGKDGSYSVANLLSFAGNLYGAAYQGGNGYGSVFKVNPKTRSLTALYAFAGGSDGAFPFW
jgi:uncharacterized repeat protein (TIGR03803 family)